jgi:hypothetical protein
MLELIVGYEHENEVANDAERRDLISFFSEDWLGVKVMLNMIIVPPRRGIRAVDSDHPKCRDTQQQFGRAQCYPNLS